MAISLTIEALQDALRVDSTEDTAQVTRLHGYVSVAVAKYAPDAPEVIQNEAAIRLAGFLFDRPNVSGDAFANALRNSGAANILLPYRIHRAGSTGEAISIADDAVGSAGNPVINVSVSGTTLTVTFLDTSSQTYELPSGGVVETPGEPGTGDDAYDWATQGNDDLIPADKYRAPTSTDRGAPIGATNNDIDEGVGSRLETFLSFHVNHIKRLVNRIVPEVFRTGNIERISEDKLPEEALLRAQVRSDDDTLTISNTSSPHGINLIVSEPLRNFQETLRFVPSGKFYRYGTIVTTGTIPNVKAFIRIAPDYTSTLTPGGSNFRGPTDLAQTGWLEMGIPAGTSMGSGLQDVGEYVFTNITGSLVDKFIDSGLTLPTNFTWLFVSVGNVSTVNNSGTENWNSSSWFRVKVSDVNAELVNASTGISTSTGTGAAAVKTYAGIHLEGVIRAGNDNLRLGKIGGNIAINLDGFSANSYSGSIRFMAS